MTDPADGLLTFVNLPTVNAHGIGMGAEAMLAAGVRVKGSIAVQRVVQPFGPTPNSPHVLGKLFIDGPLWSTGWTLGLNVQGMGNRFTESGDVPGHATANLVLRRKGLASAGEWTLGIYNVAGQRYLDPASAAVASRVVPQDGRQVRLNWELAY